MSKRSFYESINDVLVALAPSGLVGHIGERDNGRPSLMPSSSNHIEFHSSGVRWGFSVNRDEKWWLHR